MSEQHDAKVHWSYWLISTLMLIWNLLGCINFFVQMDPEVVAKYREVEQAIIQGRPLWATAGFALAVFGGAAGTVLLLLRRSAAFYLFIASLLGVLVTMAHALGVDAEFSVGELVGITAMPVAVALFLIWYSRYAGRKGWLRI